MDFPSLGGSSKWTFLDFSEIRLHKSHFWIFWFSALKPSISLPKNPSLKSTKSLKINKIRTNPLDMARTFWENLLIWGHYRTSIRLTDRKICLWTRPESRLNPNKLRLLWRKWPKRRENSTKGRNLGSKISFPSSLNFLKIAKVKKIWSHYRPISSSIFTKSPGMALLKGEIWKPA